MFALLNVVWLVGCAEPQPGGSTNRSSAVAPSDSATGAPSGATAPEPDASAAPQATTSGFPAQLVQNVEELIRLTTEYNTIAEKVYSLPSLEVHRQQLDEIDQQLSDLVSFVEADAAKLSPAQRQEFDRQYFDTRAKPQIDAKRAHQTRLRGIDFGTR